MALLLDTNILVWVTTGDARLSRRAARAVAGEDQHNCVSAITAWEFVELNASGRFGVDLDFASIIASLVVEILPLPPDLWRQSRALPWIHRDPIDRMVVAHAIAAGMPLVTSDEKMRAYPVQTIW